MFRTKELNKMLVIVMIAFMLAIQGVSGGVTCEKLPKELCAFSVSSAGKRCVLERYKEGADAKYTCLQSQLTAVNMAEWIEADECVKACGAERNWIGISSDPLLDSQFAEKLCSRPCYASCPNMVDLYFKLAEAEGISLPKVCANPRRETLESISYSAAGAPASLPSPLAHAASPASMTAPAFLSVSASTFLTYLFYMAYAFNAV